MRNITLERRRLRKSRALRVRKHIHGTSVRPRLSVVKSNKHIQVQLIDDDAGHTLGAIGTTAKEFQDTDFCGKNKVAARKLGEKIAEIAKGKNIKEVIFDRGPFKYHGILAEVADAVRNAGLKL